MKEIKVPHTFVIIFFVVVFCAILTYIVPNGQYDVHEVKYMQGDKEKSRTVLDPSSYRVVVDENGKPETSKTPIFGTEDFDGKIGILNYMFEGLVSGDKWGSAVGIVAFILVIGGAFGIMFKTGAIENGIVAVISKSEGKEFLIIPLLIILFSLGGAVFGMGEESIPFVMIVVPIVIAMGYDAVLGVMITYCATQMGFASSWMNPFSLAVAQGVSGIPVLSGAWYRIILWILFTSFEIVFCLMYAKKIKANPKLSVSYKTDEYFREEAKKTDKLNANFTLGHGLVVLTLAVTMVWVIWGVIVKGYYIPEIASQFFVMGLVAGVIGIVFKLNDMKLDDLATSFQAGASDLLGAAVVVGMAKGILIVLGGSDPSMPSVLNTILFAAGNFVSGFPSFISAWFMYIFQACFNFFVVSGSGQAALTMPIMAPLSDFAGVSRQVAVLAFQLGDGFTNLIVPTSAVLIASLGAAKIQYNQWVKFQIKYQAWMFGISSVAVMLAVLINYQ